MGVIKLSGFARNRVFKSINESDAAEQAKMLGLTYGGWGKWKDDSGKTVAKTIDDTLVKLSPEEAAAEEAGDDDLENYDNEIRGDDDWTDREREIEFRKQRDHYGKVFGKNHAAFGPPDPARDDPALRDAGRGDKASGYVGQEKDFLSGPKKSQVEPHPNIPHGTKTSPEARRGAIKNVIQKYGGAEDTLRVVGKMMKDLATEPDANSKQNLAKFKLVHQALKSGLNDMAESSAAELKARIGSKPSHSEELNKSIGNLASFTDYFDSQFSGNIKQSRSQTMSSPAEYESFPWELDTKHSAKLYDTINKVNHYLDNDDYNRGAGAEELASHIDDTMAEITQEIGPQEYEDDRF